VEATIATKAGELRFLRRDGTGEQVRNPSRDHFETSLRGFHR
jgi:hypothetical protein